MAAGRAVLESLTGRSEDDRGRIQRALDRASSSGGVSYTPASVAHWSGTAPATLQDALDRIAAMIGPIP